MTTTMRARALLPLALALLAGCSNGAERSASVLRDLPVPDQQAVEHQVAADAQLAAPETKTMNAASHDAGTADRGAVRPSGDNLTSSSPAGSPRSSASTPSAAAVAPETSSHPVESDDPTVTYTDPANDVSGWGTSGAVSQPEFDILRVDWAPASTGGYSTSMTVAGEARADGHYVSYGSFRSDTPGEDCQLYHFLTPGTTAYANAFCGSVEAGTRRHVGRVEGGKVTATPTTGGGTLLSATFSATVPPMLEAAGRNLRNLSAITCMADCSVDTLDFARSALSFRV